MKIRFLLSLPACLALVGCGGLNDPVNPKEPWTPGSQAAVVGSAPVVDRGAPTRQPGNPGFTAPAPVPTPAPVGPAINPGVIPPPHNPAVVPGSLPPPAYAGTLNGAASPTPAAPPAPGREALGNLPSLGGTTALTAGELITISFSDIVGLLPIEQRIREDGNVTLHFNLIVHAQGKTPGQLAEAIRNEYVPKYFNYLTVTVNTAERVIFVGGEVRNPSRQAHGGTKMTVTRAIDTAGGFTEFANRKAVQLIRANGDRVKINYDKAIKDPKKDPEVFPGDRVHVPASSW